MAANNLATIAPAYGSKHNNWAPVFMHTSKCDFCPPDVHNEAVLQRCRICAHQVCRDCMHLLAAAGTHEGNADDCNWTPQNTPSSRMPVKNPSGKRGESKSTPTTLRRSNRVRTNSKSEVEENEDEDEEEEDEMPPAEMTTPMKRKGKQPVAPEPTPKRSRMDQKATVEFVASSSGSKYKKQTPTVEKPAAKQVNRKKFEDQEFTPNKKLQVVEKPVFQKRGVYEPAQPEQGRKKARTYSDTIEVLPMYSPSGTMPKNVFAKRLAGSFINKEKFVEVTASQDSQVDDDTVSEPSSPEAPKTMRIDPRSARAKARMYDPSPYGRGEAVQQNSQSYNKKAAPKKPQFYNDEELVEEEYVTDDDRIAQPVAPAVFKKFVPSPAKQVGDKAQGKFIAKLKIVALPSAVRSTLPAETAEEAVERVALEKALEKQQVAEKVENEEKQTVEKESKLAEFRDRAESEFQTAPVIQQYREEGRSEEEARELFDAAKLLMEAQMGL